MSDENKHWCRDTAIEQIEDCNFQCEGGGLKMNAAYTWLKKALEIGPKYLPGQGVFYQIRGEVSGEKIEKWVHYYVIGVAMGSDTEKRLWTYTLSNDPPAPYHYGTAQHHNVKEIELALEIPKGIET